MPSPDWRDQVIYFVLTDRFADGNAGNNDQGAGEYNPQSSSHFSGGDLQGGARQGDHRRRQEHGADRDREAAPAEGAPD